MTAIFWDQALSEGAENRLREALRSHELVASCVRTGNLSATETDPASRAAEVMFGQPSLETIAGAPGLRWVHLSSAGYARYDTREARELLRERGIQLTTSSGVYAVPCAEQAIAGMLAFARRFHVFMPEQPAGGWPSDAHRAATRLIAESRVLLLGFGGIGRALAPRLLALGAEVVALRRSPRANDPVRTVSEDELAEPLANADFVVNLLPAGAATAGFLGADRLRAMKRGAILVNVGRGSTVVQDDLLAALENGQLGGAYLDVTEPEPLPREHPLWTAPNLLLSPHIAGGRPNEMLALVEHFLENFRRYGAGRRLLDQVL